MALFTYAVEVPRLCKKYIDSNHVVLHYYFLAFCILIGFLLAFTSVRFSVALSGVNLSGFGYALLGLSMLGMYGCCQHCFYANMAFALTLVGFLLFLETKLIQSGGYAHIGFYVYALNLIFAVWLVRRVQLARTRENADKRR